MSIDVEILRCALTVGVFRGVPDFLPAGFSYLNQIKVLKDAEQRGLVEGGLV